MAQTKVFVDDAVLARLPRICAKDGVPTGSRLTIDEEIGATSRIGVLWLLVFVGPIGWIALLFLAARDSGEHLVVEVPFSEAAYGRLRAARRVRNSAIAGMIAGAVVVIMASSQFDLMAAGPFLTAAVVVLGACVAITASVHVARDSVGVSLDGSRRWVTLDRVHPAFAAACRAQVTAERAP